jgi:membrane protein implicated in regulation of membrane protease activity
MYSKETVRRYILFQIPELSLTILILFIIRYFFDYPLWIVWLVVCFSIIKDVFLYRFTWKSYVVHKKEDYAGVKGRKCIAQEDILKRGIVKLNGELWKVEVNAAVKKGDTLLVTDVKGLLLIAEKVV